MKRNASTPNKQTDRETTHILCKQLHPEKRTPKFLAPWAAVYAIHACIQRLLFVGFFCKIIIVVGFKTSARRIGSFGVTFFLFICVNNKSMQGWGLGYL